MQTLTRRYLNSCTTCISKGILFSINYNFTHTVLAPVTDICVSYSDYVCLQSNIFKPGVGLYIIVCVAYYYYYYYNRSVLNDSATLRDELNFRNLRLRPACDCQVPVVECVSGIRSLTIKRACSCLLLQLHPVVGVDYYRRQC